MKRNSKNLFVEKNTQVFALTDAEYIPALEICNNNSQTFSPQSQCIHRMFEAQVERSPDAVAVVFEDTELTYRQLNHWANQLAHHLRSLGVKPEVLVGICLERSLEMVVGLLGILKAGGAYVPLDPATPPERLAFILEDTQTPVIVTQAQLRQNLPQHQAQVVCLDLDSELIAQNSQKNPETQATVSNLIYAIYTSGSTGQPKGVLISHINICNQLHWRQTTFRLTKTDKVLQTISFSFDPSVWQIFWPLCFGAQLIVPRPGGSQDSAYLVKLIAEQQITVLALVPSMLRVLLEEKKIEECKCLRHLSCGGEALPGELVERFLARLDLDNVLHNVYGPTEAAIDATFWTCQRGTKYSIAPIGRPITNAEIYILDEDLQPVAIGEPGELHIGGIGLARGYLNRPELTAEKFIPHPFSSDTEARLYKTGDLARYLPDGNIEFLGRIDHQVKIRGFRIELEEIEAVLLQYPGVEMTVVMAREDVIGDQRLVAYILPNRENQLSISELRSFLTQKLASYMIPSAFVILDTLPLTPNGKIDRRALPAPDQTRPDLEITFVAPQDPVQLQLTEIWEEVLGIQPIGITDNFFDFGGHSLVALRLLAQIEEVFGKSLALSTFLQAPTIEELAKILQQESSAVWPLLVPIQTKGDKLPLFCIHAADGNIIVYRNLVPYLGSEQPIYGLQPQGGDGKQPLHTQIEDMAAAYIQEIRSVQPKGPYLLSGHSSGGIIAFEMARQLQKQGETIGMLALFDSYSPIYFFPPSFPKWLALHCSNLLRLKPREKLNYLRTAIQERLERVRQRFERSDASSLLTTENPDTITNAIFTTQKQAVINYAPPVYSGKVILFRSEESPWWTGNNPYLGWRELVAGELEVHNIPGDHYNITRANVQDLGEKLKDCLN
jgi:amino acid adenylation domain-containing protein